MIEVAIADDHPLMLEGIKKVLNNEMDIRITKEATTSSGVMEMLKENLPDLLIMDISMPDKSGLDLLKDIRILHPNLAVLILSIHPAEKFAYRCIKAGANGYICKSAITKELVKAVWKITKEKRNYISQEVAQELATRVNGDRGIGKHQPPHEILSDREFEILCMIAEGKDVKKIASKLSLSTHTVHTYRSRIKEKLNLSTNVEMTRYALRNKLIN